MTMLIVEMYAVSEHDFESRFIYRKIQILQWMVQSGYFNLREGYSKR